jgi:hypothetical protein
LACHLQLNADPDLAYPLNVDPDPNFQSDADPCLLQINADPDLAYHLNVDPDPNFQSDAYPYGSGTATLLSVCYIVKMVHFIDQYFIKYDAVRLYIMFIVKLSLCIKV